MFRFVQCTSSKDDEKIMIIVNNNKITTEIKRIRIVFIISFVIHYFGIYNTLKFISDDINLISHGIHFSTFYNKLFIYLFTFCS